MRRGERLGARAPGRRTSDRARVGRRSRERRKGVARSDHHAGARRLAYRRSRDHPTARGSHPRERSAPRDVRRRARESPRPARRRAAHQRRTRAAPVAEERRLRRRGRVLHSAHAGRRRACFAERARSHSVPRRRAVQRAPAELRRHRPSGLRRATIRPGEVPPERGALRTKRRRPGDGRGTKLVRRGRLCGYAARVRPAGRARRERGSDERGHLGVRPGLDRRGPDGSAAGPPARRHRRRSAADARGERAGRPADRRRCAVVASLAHDQERSEDARPRHR